MSMNSVLEGLNDRKLADIQEETREIVVAVGRSIEERIFLKL